MLVLLALASAALANTESVIFEHTGVASSGSLAPLVPYTAEFLFSDSAVETLTLPITNSSAGRYLARVCWPASHSADVSIQFDPQNQAVVVTGSKEHIVPLGNHSQTVPFNVHLSPMKFGIIPVDVVPAIWSTTLVALLSMLTAYFLLKRV